ncbi:MAG: EamA family transporter, partial [Clostridia bacterium]|nr:EamA family transporter [Clostridia bacterium]
YTSPAFILILSAILFKERITLRKLTALVLTLAGCIFVSGVVGTAHSIGAFVIFTGVCSGLFYSLYTIFSRYALKKYSTETTMVYSFAFALISSAFIGKPVDSLKFVIDDPILILYALGIGLICTAMPCFLYTWGLRRVESGKAAVLSAVEPLVGAMIGMTVYGESRDLFKICGIMLIIAAIIILEFTRLKIPKKIRRHIKVL